MGRHEDNDSEEWGVSARQRGRASAHVRLKGRTFLNFFFAFTELLSEFVSAAQVIPVFSSLIN